MPRRYIASTPDRPAERLSCVVEATLAETVRDMAWQQRRTISVLVGELLREALERRGECAEQSALEAVGTTNATA